MTEVEKLVGLQQRTDVDVEHQGMHRQPCGVFAELFVLVPAVRHAPRRTATMRFSTAILLSIVLRGGPDKPAAFAFRLLRNSWPCLGQQLDANWW